MSALAKVPKGNPPYMKSTYVHLACLYIFSLSVDWSYIYLSVARIIATRSPVIFPTSSVLPCHILPRQCYTKLVSYY
ncbi:hypothetical protein BGX38DRAFT_1200542 [Terfezia claveryi]|nr:hypothetical protein BGX38DRAFT_1200542 [Terfezia claveryi]